MLSGDPADIAAIDERLKELFPDDPLLQRWLELAPERVAFQGLPARICWLGYGDRAKAGLAINELVRSGEVKAPVVIGRDHLDAGSVASPYRETEAMRDGSDAIADWPILNALVNVAAGATWVSVHHGGGVGIGNAIHAGMVVVADGTDAQAERLERVLTTDPGTGVMRHVDAATRRRSTAAEAGGLRIAARPRRRVTVSARACSSATSRSSRRPPGRDAPLRGAALGEVDVLEDAFVLCDGDTIEAVGRMRDLPALDGDVVEVDGRGLCAVPGPRRLPHACRVRRRPRRRVLAPRRRRELRGAARCRRRHPLDRPRDARGRRGRPARRGRAPPRRGCSRAGTTTFEAKSGYGLDRDTELASLRAIRDAGGVPTWLGAHAVPPEFADADAYLDFALAEVLPEAAEIAEAADVFLERGAFDAAQARRYLEACRDAGLALRLHGDQFTESGAIPLAVELGGPLGRPSRGDGRGGDPGARRRATSSACSCRRARSSSTGRCRRRERSSTPAPRSRSRPTSTRAAPSARACRSSARSRRRSCICRRRRRSPPAPSTPRTSSAAPTGSAGSRPATAPTSRSSTRPTGATSRTTSAAASSPGWSSAGELR